MNRRLWSFALAIVALALLASANSITNGFVMDDAHLIATSDRMHSVSGWWREFGHTYWPENWGGDGYRPLTIIAFRFEWVLGGGKPLLFHAVNIALHAAGSLAVLWLALAVLPLAGAFVAAALYAVHPVHVEAIANVVGQSELWVALLVTIALALFVHGRRQGRVGWKRWIVIGFLYATAMLFKEHAIVLPALILLAEFTVVEERTPWRMRALQIRLPILALGAVGVAYLWARSVVVVAGLAGFVPYIVFQALDLSASNRVLTMIGAAPEWVRLFLWPARLLTDYAPPYIDIAQGPSASQLGGLLLLVGIIGLMIACWRRSPTTSFGIGWVVLALLPASNFLVPAGFIIAERTLLLPSVGAMIAVGSAVPRVFEIVEQRRVAQTLLASFFAVLLGLGVARSISRNAVWRSNDALFRQGIVDAPLSYRAHVLLGVHLFENKRKSEGEIHYRHAIQLFPYDPMMIYDMAEKYRGAGMCQPAITLYQWLFTMRPEFRLGHIGHASCLLATLDLAGARAEALRSIEKGGSYRDAHAIITTARQVRDTLDARKARGESIPPLTPSRALR
jgi:hypothetical protein